MTFKTTKQIKLDSLLQEKEEIKRCTLVAAVIFPPNRSTTTTGTTFTTNGLRNPTVVKVIQWTRMESQLATGLSSTAPSFGSGSTSWPASTTRSTSA